MNDTRPACTLAELDAAGGRLTIEQRGREALVLRGPGGIYAIDRRCPHEGYPLDDAPVGADVLTCPWHGWRFDLRSGACLTAGEDTRAYRVEVRDGAVYVDLAGQAASPAERARLAEVLLSAVEAGQADRAARGVVRLLDAGEEPRAVAALLARYGATHGDELTPATAAVADAVRLAARAPRATTLLLAEAATVLADLDGRRPPRMPAEPASSFAYGGHAGAPEALVERVAQRDADGAEGVVAGVLARGADPAEVAAWLAVAASTRFRGPRPLALVERAGILADLDPALAGPALAAAARTVAAAAPLDGVAPYRGRATAGENDPLAAADDLAATIAAFDVASERDVRGGSLLAVAEALVHAHAADWSRLRPPAAHAAWLAEDARAWRRADAPATLAVPDEESLVDEAVSAGASPTASALCFAAARVALELDRPAVLAAVALLLRTPRRERFTERAVAAEQERLYRRT